MEDFKILCKEPKFNFFSITSDITYFFDIITQSIGLYNQKIHVLSEMNKNIVGSINKAEEILKYKPKYSLKDGIRNSMREIYK